MSSDLAIAYNNLANMLEAGVPLQRSLNTLIPGLKGRLQGDHSTIVDPRKPKDETSRPLAWYQELEGGRCWYTTLGHRKEVYHDPAFRRHIAGGILWAMGVAKP